MNSTARLVLVLALSAPTRLLYAQESAPPSVNMAELAKEVRTLLRKDDYAKALDKVREAIRNKEGIPASAELYRMEVTALDGLVEAENRKIYLAQNPDSASFFNRVFELYVAGLKCDSAETSEQVRRPDSSAQRRRNHSGVGRTMLRHRANLLNSGKYYYNKRDYPSALRFLEMYVDTKGASVFIDPRGRMRETDPDDFLEVSRLAVLSAYAAGAYESVLRRLNTVLGAQGEQREQLLEVGAKSALLNGSAARAEDLLRTGADEAPQNDYFPVALLKLYNDRGRYADALALTEKMVASRPQDRDWWFMRGQVQLLTGLHDEALVSFGKCVSIKADDAEAHAAAGAIHLRRAQEAYARFNLPLSHRDYKRRKQEILHLYEQACDSFELSRQYGAGRDLWMDGLREAYFHLNRGDQLKELEK